MIHLDRPSRANAALATAKAAVSFADDGDGQLGAETLALALRMGADPADCACLYATMGCAPLLRACLAHGADPRAIREPVDHEPLILSQTDFPDGASLMSRALLAGSADCCRTLADHGVDMLADPHCASMARLVRDDGGSRWAAAMAGLSRSAPSPASAQALALAMLPMASLSFRQNRQDMSSEPRAAMEALRRLVELGADLGAQPSGASAGRPSHSAGSALFASAMAHLAVGPASKTRAAAIDALVDFCIDCDPAGSRSNLKASIAALSTSPGGALSSLPEAPGAASLRRACSLFAQRCDAPLAIMELLLDDLAAGKKSAAQSFPRAVPRPQASLCERAQRHSMMFLLDGCQAWPTLSEEQAARGGELLAGCLKASATFWGKSPLARPGDPASAEAWLAWALASETAPNVQRPASAWPLMAAKLAAASDGRLAEAFERMAARASLLALPGIDPDLHESLSLSVDIAAQSRAPVDATGAPLPPAPQFRI